MLHHTRKRQRKYKHVFSAAHKVNNANIMLFDLFRTQLMQIFSKKYAKIKDLYFVSKMFRAKLICSKKFTIW